MSILVRPQQWLGGTPWSRSQDWEVITVSPARIAILQLLLHCCRSFPVFKDIPGSSAAGDQIDLVLIPKVERLLQVGAQ